MTTETLKALGFTFFFLFLGLGFVFGIAYANKALDAMELKNSITSVESKIQDKKNNYRKVNEKMNKSMKAIEVFEASIEEEKAKVLQFQAEMQKLTKEADLLRLELSRLQGIPAPADIQSSDGVGVPRFAESD